MTKILVFLSLCFALAFLVLGQLSLKNEEKRVFYFAPPEVIHHFSLGFSDLYADILWMRLIQDIDFCSSKKGMPVYDGKTKYQCKKGWSYKMTEAITNLAPFFLNPYEISGTIMSVIMGDKQGAKKIYDKGVKNFPHNWKIHFSAGYHYLLELEEKEKAAKLLLKAAKLGGPYWLYALAAKTYGNLGKLLLSREILISAIKNDITGQYKEALELRLKKVEQRIKEIKESEGPL